MKMNPQQYCLRWKHHHSNVQSMFSQLLEKERFCDVTLYCSPSFNGKDGTEHNLRGVSLRAHRVVLAACSELLGSLLGAHESQGEPVLVVDGAEPRHVRALLRYMYTGEMSVHHSQLAGLLKTAEELRIKGLTDIRWNNKDPPDCKTGNLGITSTSEQPPHDDKSEHDDQLDTLRPKSNKTYDAKKTCIQPAEAKKSVTEAKKSTSEAKTEAKGSNFNAADVIPTNVCDVISAELKAYLKQEPGDLEKHSVNGGPPPLIKLPEKHKNSLLKSEPYDVDSPSPKRRRMTSGGSEHTDDGLCGDKDAEWQHGNMDISAERVATWGGGSGAGGGWSRDNSDDEWALPATDIGSFLTTSLTVDGDNTNDEESNDGSHESIRTSSLRACTDTKDVFSAALNKQSLLKGGDPRFSDVVKLNDYLQHGRRPQFWEENYVKRVMEAVRLKQLEMKQAAEILGVSYGTLYGRYRDVYGCINRPYRSTHDFWLPKGPSDVLDRLQRGEISLDAASQGLGVSNTNLAAYLADVSPSDNKTVEFEPIPIEVDPSIKIKTRIPFATSGAIGSSKSKNKPPATDNKAARKPTVSGTEDDDGIPASVIVPDSPGGKYPSIRVASLDTLRASPPTPAVAATPTPAAPPATSPTALMRNRPDLTILPSKRDS